MKKIKNKLKKLLQCMRMHSMLIHTYIHTYIQYKSVIFQKYHRNIKGTLYISQKSK